MNKAKQVMYFLLILITIPLGLGTRSKNVILPDFIRIYGGDVLYATCVFFVVRFLALRKPLWKIALIAYLICISIEISQLYQEPWIQKIRHTFPFGLLLGYGFLWSDWVCYAVGVIMALIITFLLEKFLFTKEKKKAFN